MYNSVLLIGRTTDKPKIRQLESGVMVGNLTLAVNRPFKNTDGQYETDFINCTLWNGIASSANEFWSGYQNTPNAPCCLCQIPRTPGH